MNTECKKIGCQRECRYTANKDYSIDGKYYKYNEFRNNYEEETGEIIKTESLMVECEHE